MPFNTYSKRIARAFYLQEQLPVICFRCIPMIAICVRIMFSDPVRKVILGSANVKTLKLLTG